MEGEEGLSWNSINEAREHWFMSCVQGEKKIGQKK